MRRIQQALAGASIPLLLLGLAGSVALAEVAATSPGERTGAIVFEVPDPAPQAVWRPVRPDAGPLALEPQAEARGDLAPAIGVNPTTGRPEAVWPYWDGTDYELAWSAFDGSAWSAPLLLTDNAVDDLRPAVAFAADGSLGIAFESHETPVRIVYLEHDPSAGWSPEIVVSDATVDATAPSIAFHAGVPHVGYHEQAETAAPVFVARGGGGFPDPWPLHFLPELVGSTDKTADPAQDVRTAGGTLYSVWVLDDSLLAYARRIDGAWQPVEHEPYAGAQDIPRARLRIRARILRGN